MKARKGKLGDFVMTLLLLGIGALLIYGNMVNREMGNKIASLLVKQWVGAALGLIMILAVLLRWVGCLGHSKERFVDFQSEDGNVGISTKAIQDFIERVGKEFAAVRSIDSRLIHNKGMLDIAVSVRVQSGNRIPELSQVLQQRIRESVRESLGLEGVGKITIQVKEIVGAPDKPVNRDEGHGA